MQLSQQEIKLVERLRKEERSWRSWRWCLIGLGILIQACYGYLLFSMTKRLESVADVTALGPQLIDILCLWPKCMIMLPVGFAMVLWPIIRWQGNAQRRLLLRLLDAHQDQTPHGVQTT